MLTMSQIIVHFLEGAAVTGAIYLVTKRSLELREVSTLVLTITVTFMVLDLFAPTIGAGARQGSGFGLGFAQIAGDGNTMPRHFYEGEQPVVEGMDDPVALEYYAKYGPHAEQAHTVSETEQMPSEILQEYAENPFETATEKEFAAFP
jgi:hypothetical protein